MTSIEVEAQARIPGWNRVAPPGGHQNDPQLVREVGGPVIPIFEGWFPNPDGTYQLCFGYFNTNTIETFDNTNEQDRHAIDQFLLDKDIVDIIKEHIHSADLTPEFHTSFPELARKLWSGTTFPDYARETLGYP